MFQAGLLKVCLWKWCEKETLPGRVDLQSVHAGACSTKVGPFGKKSSPGRLQEAISEMFASFWGSFGSTLPPFGRPRAHLSLHGIFITIFMIFSGQRAPPSPPQRDICSMGRTSGVRVKHHFGTITAQKPGENSISAKLGCPGWLGEGKRGEVTSPLEAQRQGVRKKLFMTLVIEFF